MKDYKYFKVFLICCSLYIFAITIKNYYIIYYTNKIDFELVEINKYWDRKAYASKAVVKIKNEVYTFKVSSQYFDIYKNTKKIEFNVYFDFITKEYITTSDYWIMRNLSFVIIFLNLLAFTKLSKFIYSSVDFVLSKFINWLNRVF